MSRSIARSLQTFFKNMWRHAKRVLEGRETPLEALQGIGSDLHKLRHGVMAGRRSGEEKEARRMLEKGRKAYNEKRYTEAQHYLLRALEYDEHLGWAHCFLGHTAYQLGHVEEAATHWHRTIMMEPNSPAAEKAQKKLDGLSSKRRDVLADLERHVRESNKAPREP